MGEPAIKWDCHRVGVMRRTVLGIWVGRSTPRNEAGQCRCALLVVQPSDKANLLGTHTRAEVDLAVGGMQLVIDGALVPHGRYAAPAARRDAGADRNGVPALITSHGRHLPGLNDSLRQDSNDQKGKPRR